MIRKNLLLLGMLILFTLPWLHNVFASFLIPSEHIVYLPVVNKPRCLSYDVSMWIEAPDQVRVGESFTATVSVQNDGCSSIGRLIYYINTEPEADIQPSFSFSTSNGAGPNGLIHQEIVVYTPKEASVLRISAGAAFEVAYPDSFLFGRGNAGSSPVTIQVVE